MKMFWEINNLSFNRLNLSLKYFLAFLLTTALSFPLQASFQYQPTSVRASAMGNAFMGSANEAAALFSNPAGIALLPVPEMAFAYGKPFTGLEDVNMNVGHAAFVMPTRVGNWGVGMALFHAQSLVQERTVAVSYGQEIFNKARVGLNFKHLFHSYDINSDPLAAQDPVFQNGHAKGAFSFDAGLIVPAGRYVNLGLAVKNINEPNVGIYSKDVVAREYQGGAAVNFDSIGLKATGDLFMRRDVSDTTEEEHASPQFGLEKSLAKESLFLRLGTNKNEYTGGFGLKQGNFGFDYALVLTKTLMEDNMGTHRVGMTYRFISSPFMNPPAAVKPAAMPKPAPQKVPPSRAPEKPKAQPEPKTKAKEAPAQSRKKRPQPQASPARKAKTPPKAKEAAPAPAPAPETAPVKPRRSHRIDSPWKSLPKRATRQAE